MTTTHTVGDGADLITYDVHGDLSAASAQRPVLMLAGSPMDAGGFAALRALVTDRPVVTLDPRGAGRNPTGTTEVTPARHADDLHRVIAALDVGPVDLFGSSGGGVNALALIATHPDDIRRVVAHEPPVATWLPDADVVLAASRRMKRVYEQRGAGPAMALFIDLLTQEGPLPGDYAERPLPDPAAFGMATDDDGDRSMALMRNTPSCQELEPDEAALRALGTRLMLGVGATGGHQIAGRGARSVAERLGRAPVVFPGGHNGFSPGGDGWPAGDPAGFAQVLLGLLD